MKRLIKWLYIKFVSPDLVGMTRSQAMGRIQHASWESLEKDKQKEIIEKCIDYQNEGVINWIVSGYIKDVMDNIAYHAPDINQIFADRFSINGASAIEERIAFYASLQEKDEPFDKFATL